MKNNDALIKKGTSPLLQLDLTKGRPAHLSLTLFPINMTERNGKIHQIMTIVQGLHYVFGSSWNIHKTFLTIARRVFIHLKFFSFIKKVEICYKRQSLSKPLAHQPRVINPLAWLEDLSRKSNIKNSVYAILPSHAFPLQSQLWFSLLWCPARLQRASRFACFYASCFIILHMLQEHFRSLMCFATAQASRRSQLLTFSTPQGLSSVPHSAFNLLRFLSPSGFCLFRHPAILRKQLGRNCLNWNVLSCNFTTLSLVCGFWVVFRRHMKPKGMNFWENFRRKKKRWDRCLSWEWRRKKLNLKRRRKRWARGDRGDKHLPRVFYQRSGLPAWCEEQDSQSHSCFTDGNTECPKD